MEQFFILYCKDGHATFEPASSEKDSDFIYNTLTDPEKDFYDTIALMFGDINEPYYCKTIKEYK